MAVVVRMIVPTPGHGTGERVSYFAVAVADPSGACDRLRDELPEPNDGIRLDAVARLAADTAARLRLNPADYVILFEEV